jgi:hypothetical protein
VIHKHGTVVITLSAAAYEIFKSSVYRHFDNSDTLKYKLTTRTSSNRSLNREIVVEESISVRSINGGRQMYRINFFNTTSRVDINGHRYRSFIEEELPSLCAGLSSDNSITEINNEIAHRCTAAIAQLNGLYSRDGNSSANAVHTLSPYSPTVAGIEDQKTVPPLVVPEPVQYDCDSPDPDQLASYSVRTEEVEERAVSDPPPNTDESDCMILVTKRAEEVEEVASPDLPPHADDTPLELADESTYPECPHCSLPCNASDCIECSTCGMWPHVQCEKLPLSEFIRYDEDPNLNYQCISCEILQDPCVMQDTSQPEDNLQQRTIHLVQDRT